MIVVVAGRGQPFNWAVLFKSVRKELFGKEMSFENVLVFVVVFVVVSVVVVVVVFSVKMDKT